MSNSSETLGDELFLDTDFLEDIKATFDKLGGDIEVVHVLTGLSVVILLSLACITLIECFKSCCDNKRYTFQDVETRV